MKNRISWDEYFSHIAKITAMRSTCIRRQIGSIITKDNNIISSGYNGACKKNKDCFELGCLRDELNIESGTRHEICRAVHAEQNAIIQAASNGVSIKGGTMYCTYSPCFICAKMIVNAGISRIVLEEKYPDDQWISLFIESGIEICVNNKDNFSIQLKKKW